MTVKIGINGFGRIGRSLVRAIMAQQASDVEVVAINDPFGDADSMAFLLKHDSVSRTLPNTIVGTDKGIEIDGNLIQKTAEREPANIPWGDLGVDIVIESSGVFTDRDAAAGHLKGGAKTVIISAPSGNADASFCYGINHKDYDPAQHKVISNASCTTNCLAPLVKVLNDEYGIETGFMLTIHAYTSDQQLQDQSVPSRSGKIDYRRMRAAALSIIPSSTGAAKAIGSVIPEVDGKLDGMAMRVPTPTGSITDLTVTLNKEVTKEEVNAAFKKASEDPSFEGVLEYTEEELVSADIVHNPASVIFSSPDTLAKGKNVKVLGWYDNEWGYSNRLVDLCQYIGKQL